MSVDTLTEPQAQMPYLRGYFSPEAISPESESVRLPFKHGNATESAKDPVQIRPVSQRVRACHTFDREALLEYRRQIAAVDPGGELVHSAVWCVSFDSFDSQVFRPLAFESSPHYPEDKSDRLFINVLHREVNCIRKMGDLHPTLENQPRTYRLKLPSQIWIEDNIESLDLSLELTTVPMKHLPHVPPLTEEQKQNSFLTVYYVELQPYRPNSPGTATDGTISLNGSQSLVQTVDVLHKDPSDEPTAPVRPVKIERSQVCGSGSHVLTLSFTKTRAHLDLWKLVDPTRTASTATSEQLSNSPNGFHNLSHLADDHPWVAHTDFSITRNGLGHPPSLEIAISHDASRIAVFPSIDLGRSEFPGVAFLLYEYSQHFTPAETSQTSATRTSALNPGSLEPNHPLNGFSGFGRFHILDWEKERSPKQKVTGQENTTARGTDITQEAFVACNGLTVSVYETRKLWTRTFDLRLSDPVTIAPKATSSDTNEDRRTREEEFQDVIQSGAKMLIGSLRGPICAWANPEEFSVWDLRKGCLLSQSPMPEFCSKITDISFSSDGVLMVITMNSSTCLFNTMTGTEVQSCFRQNSGMTSRFLDDCHLLCYATKGEPCTISYPATNGRFADQKLQIPYSDFGVQHLFSVDKPDKKQNRGLQLNLGDRLGSGSAVLDEETVETIEYHHNDELFWQRLGESTSGNMILLAQGSSLSVYGLKETIVLTTTDVFNETSALEIDTWCTNARLRPHVADEEKKPQQLVTISGYHYSLHLRPGIRSIMTLTVQGPDDKGPKLIQYLRSWWGEFKEIYFLPCKTRFLAWSKDMIWVWGLPRYPSRDLECELLAMRSGRFFGCLKSGRYADLDWNCEGNVVLCDHGNSVRYINPDISADSYQYFEFHTQTLMSPEHIRRAIRNIPSLVALYSVSKDNPRHQKEILRYMLKYIGRHPDIYSPTYTVLDEIVLHSSKMVDGSLNGYDIFLRDLLQTGFNGDDDTPWYPCVSNRKDSNIIKRTLSKTRFNPRMLDMAVILMDYCVRMAKRKHDVGFLSVVLEILPDLIDQEPDLAREVMYRCAFIQAKEREYVIRRAQVYQAARFTNFIPSWLRKPRSKVEDNFFTNVFGEDNPLADLDNDDMLAPMIREVTRCALFDVCQAQQGSVAFQARPVVPSSLQLDIQEGEKMTERFAEDVYVAPFQLLWHVQNRNSQDEEKGSKPLKLKVVDSKTTWWKSSVRLVMLNILPREFQFIRTHALNLKFFDNPAIAALLEYKWNMFGRSYWMVRFVSQCIYYILVLTVTFCQVYLEYPEDLKLAFVGIIVVAAVFLWLEFQQFLRNPRGYLSSPYNYVDITVFALPLAASAAQIYEITRNGDGATVTGNTRPFSFSILVIYLHLLFELRVIKSVCHFVTIILSVIRKIRVFFIIFAISIVAFSHAFLHLLWGKTFKSENVDNQAANFTRSFPAAVSATYFFMGGLYDPVADKFGSDDVAFHIMMIIYFFMTVILMLNVLIALINVAFNTGDDSWRLVWIENRLRSIESAENMSFHTPGFRNTYPWFPSEIYYSVPAKQVQEYTAKYLQKDLLMAVHLHNPELAKPEDPAKNKDALPTLPGTEHESKDDQAPSGEVAEELVDPSSSASAEGGPQVDAIVEDLDLERDTAANGISTAAIDNTLPWSPPTFVSSPTASQEISTDDTTSALLEELQSLKAIQE